MCVPCFPLVSQSRALGDFQYKDESLPPEKCKVTVVPETQSVPRSLDEDEFLVLACDGIWDVMSNEVSGGSSAVSVYTAGGRCNMFREDLLISSNIIFFCVLLVRCFSTKIAYRFHLEAESFE